MKKSLILVASLITLAGCQQDSVRPQTTNRAPNAADKLPKSNQLPVSAIDEQETSQETASAGDVPDDPGLTVKRDKTLKQERPSGDESSQAAPNEGDAEPPQ